MTTRLLRCCASTVAALAVTATLLASPAAAAAPGPGGDDLPLPDRADTGDVDTPADPADTGDLLEPEPVEPGPVGHTGAATYAMVSTPGGQAPHSLAAVGGADSIGAVAATLSDGAFLAVVVIDDANDPTEFRFDGAVPDGHTARIQPDGSVSIFDPAGNRAGGWEKSWAVDAAGNAVSTNFTIDGTTLVQTVDHTGHAYPVVADPCGGWVKFFACAAAAVSITIAASSCMTGVGCAAGVAQAVVAVGAAVAVHVEPSQPSEQPQPAPRPQPKPKPRPRPRCPRPGCR